MAQAGDYAGVCADFSGKRGEEGPVVHGALDSGDQKPGGFRLTNATESAGTLSPAQNFRIFIQGGNHDGNLRTHAHDFPRGVKAVATRHDGIHDDNVGMQRARTFHGLFAVRCFSTDFPTILGLEQMAEKSPDDFVIVHQEDTKVLHAEHSGTRVARR